MTFLTTSLAPLGMEGMFGGEFRDGWVPLHAAVYPGFGEVAALTHPGIGYKDDNEDGWAFHVTPSGRKLRFLLSDGVGGRLGAKAATITALRAFDALRHLERSDAIPLAFSLGHRSIVTSSNEATHFDAGTAVLGGELALEGEPGSPFSLFSRLFWAGNVSATLLKDTGRALACHYRTREDSLALDLIRPGVDFEAGGRGRTLAMQAHPWGHVITNYLGLHPLQIRTTRNGLVPSADITRYPDGYRPAEVDQILVEAGMWMVAGTDGFWENFATTAAVARLLYRCRTAEEAGYLLAHQVLSRQNMLSLARQSGKTRVDFSHDGHVLSLDPSTGIVYRGTGETCDHYKLDNFAFIVFHAATPPHPTSS